MRRTRWPRGRRPKKSRRRNPMSPDDVMVFFDEVLTRGGSVSPGGVLVEVMSERPLQVDVGEGDLEPEIDEYLRELRAEVKRYPWRERDERLILQARSLLTDRAQSSLRDQASGYVEDLLQNAGIDDPSEVYNFDPELHIDMVEWPVLIEWPVGDSALDLLYEDLREGNLDEFLEIAEEMARASLEAHPPEDNPSRRHRKR